MSLPHTAKAHPGQALLVMTEVTAVFPSGYVLRQAFQVAKEAYQWAGIWTEADVSFRSFPDRRKRMRFEPNEIETFCDACFPPAPRQTRASDPARQRSGGPSS